MTRCFRITVGGQAYEVEVEELGQAARPAAAHVAATAPRPEPKPIVAAAPPRPQSRPTAAPTSKPSGGGAPAGKGVLTAPIPGVISDVKVKAGQAVKARDIVLVLEAMKMQNEILAPQDGVVKEVFVSAGSNVNTGDKLVVIED